MNHVILDLTKHYELWMEDEVLGAVVELTPEFCREALRRMDLFVKLKQEEPSLSALIFLDNDSVQFVNVVLVPEERDNEGIPEELRKFHFVTKQALPLQDADIIDSVEFPHMVVDEAMVYWRAYEDHVEQSFETHPIHRPLLEWALGES